jgi:hypothetical protein
VEATGDCDQVEGRADGVAGEAAGPRLLALTLTRRAPVLHPAAEIFRG